MNEYSLRNIANRRAGVTILEVLFATGIVIFGILGIAALIPLAARNANQANEANEGQAYGQRYYAEFIARGFNNSATWRWFNDATKTFGPSFNHATNIAVDRWQWWQRQYVQSPCSLHRPRLLCRCDDGGRGLRCEHRFQCLPSLSARPVPVLP